MGMKLLHTVQLSLIMGDEFTGFLLMKNLNNVSAFFISSSPIFLVPIVTFMEEAGPLVGDNDCIIISRVVEVRSV